MKLTNLNQNQTGFTIIELMIATSLFTVIILLVAITTTGIGSLYQKGVNQTLIQDSTQSIAAEISQHIQLGDNYRTSTPLGTNPMAYCFGTVKYSVLTDKKLGTNLGNNESPYVIWRENITSTAACAPIANNVAALTASKNDPVLQGTELIANNSRITFFDIPTAPTPPPFFFSISEAYGDDDLLNLNGYASRCKGDIGQQFCSTATLTTAVTQRLQ